MDYRVKIRIRLRGLKLAIRQCSLGLLYWLLRSERILVLGDSHAGVFDKLCIRKRFPRKNFIMGHVQGATVSGLENPGSKTQAKKFFLEMLHKETYDRVIIQIGEVDTGFVIWYRSQKYGVEVEEMYNLAVSNYRTLIQEVCTFAPTIVISAPLPTISDGYQWGEVANARKDVKTTQVERTKLTLDFNSEIQKLCGALSVPYISLDQVSIGEDGIVHDWLKNANHCDHHYSHSAYAEILAPPLKKLIGS